MKKKAGLKIDTVLPQIVLGKATSYDFIIPYAGRWIVIVGDRVVASGETARSATSKIPKRIKREESLLFKVPAEPDKLLVV